MNQLAFSLSPIRKDCSVLLNVSLFSTVPGHWYCAAPVPAGSGKWPPTEESLKRLARRIELVGKEIFSNDLLQVDTEIFEGAIGIRISRGLLTSSEKS